MAAVAMGAMAFPAGGMPSASKQAPPPAPPLVGGLTQAQRHYMGEIVRGMKAGEIGTVASALSGAVNAGVSIPDAFLGTVKQWMDSRQKTAPRFPHVLSAAQAAQQGHAGAAMPEGSFQLLHQQLEAAIRRNDTQTMKTILGEAARLAATGGVQGVAGPLSPLGALQLGGGVTPLIQGAGGEALGGAFPGGGLTPQILPGGATPLVAQDDYRPALMGGATPQLHTPSVTMQGMPVPPKQDVKSPFQHLGAQKREESPAPPGARGQKRRPTLKEKPEDDKLAGPSHPLPDAKRPRTPKALPAAESPAPVTMPHAVSPHDSRLAPTSPMDAFDAGLPGMDDVPDEVVFWARDPTPEAVADFLRTRDDDCATFRQICVHMRPQPSSEAVRRVVESNPSLFAVNVDKVTLTDPGSKEALASLVQELVQTPLTRKVIMPDDAAPHIKRAVEFATRSSPRDVAKVLLNVSKKTLRKTGKVSKGKHPANMPLVIACIVDRILAGEKQQGFSRRFENMLGPSLHKMIFQHWVVGVTPGSQFLANVLLAWERLGYFRPKHLEECRKAVLVLLAYARAEGVQDGADKEHRAGWYRIVAREPGTHGAQSLAPSDDAPSRPREPPAEAAAEAAAAAETLRSPSQPTHPEPIPPSVEPSIELPPASGTATTPEAAVPSVPSSAPDHPAAPQQPSAEEVTAPGTTASLPIAPAKADEDLSSDAQTFDLFGSPFSEGEEEDEEGEVEKEKKQKKPKKPSGGGEPAAPPAAPASSGAQEDQQPALDSTQLYPGGSLLESTQLYPAQGVPT